MPMTALERFVEVDPAPGMIANLLRLARPNQWTTVGVTATGDRLEVAVYEDGRSAVRVSIFYAPRYEVATDTTSIVERWADWFPAIWRFHKMIRTPAYLQAVFVTGAKRHVAVS